MEKLYNRVHIELEKKRIEENRGVEKVVERSYGKESGVRNEGGMRESEWRLWNL